MTEYALQEKTGNFNYYGYYQLGHTDLAAKYGCYIKILML